MMNSALDAEEVTKLLGIKKQTLYAYASRGLLRRVTAPGSKRSLYAREDVEKLINQKQEREGTSNGNARRYSPASGDFVTTSITEITTSGPRYRGYNVQALATHPGRIENVAELLWTGVLTDE